MSLTRESRNSGLFVPRLLRLLKPRVQLANISLQQLGRQHPGRNESHAEDALAIVRTEFDVPPLRPTPTMNRKLRDLCSGERVPSHGIDYVTNPPRNIGDNTHSGESPEQRKRAQPDRCDPHDVED